MKHKINCFIVVLILFPFILGLFVLKMNNFLKEDWYIYLNLVLSCIFLIYFILSLFYAFDDIRIKGPKYNYFFLIFFPFLYLPYHYGKMVNEKDKYLAYSLIFLNLILIGGFYFSSKGIIYNYFYHENEGISLKDTFAYSDRQYLFTIDINKDFNCSRVLGEYSLVCENESKDSFLGIYTYEGKKSEAEIDDIMDFHLEQTISYMEEKDYEYQENNLEEFKILKYNDMYKDMEIILTSRIYLLDDKEYMLIFVYECPIHDHDIYDLENIMETVKFAS